VGSAESTTGARFITGQMTFLSPNQQCQPAKCSERITLLLHDLHWLRALERIQFRFCILMFQRISAAISRWERSLDSRCQRSSPPPLICHHNACCPVSAAINSWWPCLSWRCITVMEQPTTFHPNPFIPHLLSATAEDTFV